VTRRQLDELLSRLADARSLATFDRICLGYTAGGDAPDDGHSVSWKLHWRGSVIPWWLAPLRLVVAANRTLFEITDSRELPGFVRGTDSCFTVEIYSCPRTLLPAVVEHMSASGVTASPGEVIDQDSAYFELEINCDGGPHESWLVSARYGSDCPQDLAALARAIDEEYEADDDLDRG
jgi:hypothetical protein